MYHQGLEVVSTTVYRVYLATVANAKETLEEIEKEFSNHTF